MNWTWLGLAVLVLLAFSMVDGYRHGFVKEVVSALLVLISVALVWLINPYVNQFIRENTSVYEKIQTASGSFVDSLADGKETMDEEEQKALISSMDIPDLLQKGITENNTALVYQYLAVNTFAGYISGYLANVAVNCLSFLVSYILSSILIHVLAYAMDLLARLPVIRGINKIAGAVVGGMKCIVFVWVGMLVLTILCNTEIGQKGLGLIRGDTVLDFLYDKNIFIHRPLIIKFNRVINFNLNIIECGIFLFIIMNGIPGITFHACPPSILPSLTDFESSLIGVASTTISTTYVQCRSLRN